MASSTSPLVLRASNPQPTSGPALGVVSLASASFHFDLSMASSRGRERAQQRGPRVFVFGSSTPRDLSHLSKIPAHLRKYDARIVKEAVQGPKLSDYMQKARSLTREGNTSERGWAFGSSTPRDFAHLTSLKPAQRRYDAVIPKKSSTTPNFVATPIKRSSTVTPVTRQQQRQKPQPRPDTQREEQIDRLIKDDDVSSEPDFVQDRGNFLNELKVIKENQMRQEAEKQAENARELEEDIFVKPDEIGSEAARSQVVPPHIHDEEMTNTASHRPAQPVLHDQVTISNLTEDNQIEGDSVASQKVGELLKERKEPKTEENAPPSEEE